MAATVDFRVRFRHALMVGEEAAAEARVVRSRGRMVEAEATLTRRLDGAVLAEATSKLLKA
jgi:acyl-coenzyme A thioesterase PaaI-like protein